MEMAVTWRRPAQNWQDAIESGQNLFLDCLLSRVAISQRPLDGTDSVRNTCVDQDR